MLAVTPYYEPEGGGLERYAHEVLRRLAARGHDVRVLTMTRRGLASGLQGGLPVERLPPRFLLSNTPIHPAFRGRVAGAIASFAPDVVMAHAPVPFPAEMAYLAARRARVPFVLTYHAGHLEGGSPLLDLLAGLDRATLERRMISEAAGLIAVSPYVRDHALAARRGEVRVIPPGVDAERFRPARVPHEPSVLFVGPLDKAYRWKGVDVLWDAFHLVHEDIPEATLGLVGTGDRLEELRRRAAVEGLDGAVAFAGRLSDAALVRAYQAATVTVLPSTRPAEAFGLVLAEANACGRPVVGTRMGGIPDFVRHGENGLLVEPSDAEGLARALVTVLQDRALAARLGAEGRKRVLAEHGWEGLVDRTEAALHATARRAEAMSA